MDLQGIYLGFLSAMFLFWNSVRILTYVPTILKLMRPSASARDYSIATWSSWVLSNGFFALYLWEHDGRQLSAMVLLNVGNTCMCLITCYFILKLQRRARSARSVATAAFLPPRAGAMPPTPARARAGASASAAGPR